MMTSSVVEMQMTSPTEGTPTGVQLPEFSQLVSPPLVTHVRSHVPGNPAGGRGPAHSHQQGGDDDQGGRRRRA